MKKILLILFILLIAGCSKQKTILFFEGQKLNDDFAKIYQLDEKNAIYSMYTEVKYIDKSGNKIDLGKALEEKLITIDEIVKKMEYVAALNDGGTIYYSYDVKNNNLANINFNLLNCDTRVVDNQTGEYIYIKNIYLSDKDIVDYCKKDYNWRE